MTLKKSKLFMAAVMLAVSVGAGQMAFASPFVSIATGGTSGTYYPIGGAIAKTVSSHSDLKVTAETGNASVANINLVGKGDIEIAFAQNDIAFWAYHGQMMFKKPVKNLRAVASLYPEHMQLIVTKEAKIETFADLKGKRVGVGAPGSGVEADVKAVMGIAKLSYDDMKVSMLDFGATTNRFKDNQIDAGFVVAGFPTASIMDLATSKDITLFNFSDDFLAQLIKEHPYFVSGVIPANTYSGIDKEIKTPAVMAMLVTHEEVPEDVVYAFTKAMFENLSAVHASHAKATEINLQTALDGRTIPLHPGAAKYFKEKGLNVD